MEDDLHCLVLDYDILLRMLAALLLLFLQRIRWDLIQIIHTDDFS